MHDEQLVSSFQNGQDEAFVQLYERYFLPLYRFVRQKVSSATEAEDITQDVFLSVCEELRHVTLTATFRAWLFGITANKIKTFWLQHYQMPVESIDLLLETKGEESFVEHGKQRPAIDLSDETILTQLLKVLPEQQAKVVYWRFYRNLTREETAATLATSENNIKVWQYRALQTLRQVGPQFLMPEGNP